MKEKAKRAYKKPEVFEVKLTPEEAVLTNCKTSTTVGAAKGVGSLKCSGVCLSAVGS